MQQLKLKANKWHISSMLMVSCNNDSLGFLLRLTHKKIQTKHQMMNKTKNTERKKASGRSEGFNVKLEI